MKQTNVLKSNEQYFQVSWMILELMIVLPFVFIYKSIKFLGE